MKIITTDYDFPVSLQDVLTTNPMQSGSDVIRDRKAVVRQDNGRVLGIVSSKYELLKHADIIDAFRKALAGVDYSEKIQVVDDGAALFTTYKLEGRTIEVQKGDVVSLQFIVKNSYNGSNALQIMLGAFRLVCMNGMIVGKQFFNYSQKHIGSTSGLRIEVIKEKVDMLTKQFSQTLPFLQEMSRHSLNASPDELFTQEAIPFPKYLLDIAKEHYAKDEDNTRWGFYNGLTNAITHSMKHESPEATLSYSKLAWELAQKI